MAFCLLFHLTFISWWTAGPVSSPATAVLYCSFCTHHCTGQGWSLLSPTREKICPLTPTTTHQTTLPLNFLPSSQPCTFIFNHLHFEGLSPVPIDLALDIELFSSLQDKLSQLSQLPAVAEPAAKYELERRQLKCQKKRYLSHCQES